MIDCLWSAGEVDRERAGGQGIACQGLPCTVEVLKEEKESWAQGSYSAQEQGKIPGWTLPWLRISGAGCARLRRVLQDCRSILCKLF